ncbi:MAG: hypothetical protein MET45_23795 [Nostoc sp. LLA-1]|nr:hypothetical protein [Cyanocohniella sp. LLY]
MSIFKAIIPLFGVVTIGYLSSQIPVYAQAQTSLKSFNLSNQVAVAFPITGDRDDAVANGRMRTSFTLTKNGGLSAVTNYNSTTHNGEFLTEENNSCAGWVLTKERQQSRLLQV